ncbi:ESF1 homolog [Styela clava]|uniref:ESF1 homolog n=1 Tax=Styela clava TaxID=7725 RepID=UPI001939DA61|nr:ESF1 homolog [Styela clava]
MDERFEIVKRDHRFRPIRQKQRKIQIDNRFHGVFTKKSFREHFTVDKRGRPIKESTSKNLRKFYHLSKAERKRIHKERIKTRAALKKQLGGHEFQNEHDIEQKGEDHKVPASKDRINDSDSDSSYFSSEDEDSDIDLARGKGNVESSSDEENEVDQALNNSNILDHDWGEMDNMAPRSEETSNRLALCGMDWDRVHAADLFVLLDSFKPSGGSIKSITIYPSEYGSKRIAEEEKMGPAELKEMKQDELEEEWHKEEGEQFNMEKLRQYQLNRLKYYYAVIECDSMATAEKIYQECDGTEFETSCSKIDLRFIPDGMEFNDFPPKETAASMPDLAKYKPISFITAALNQTKVNLTWDETDHKRTALTKGKFTKDELENMDVRDFLASSSSDSEGGDESQSMNRSNSNMNSNSLQRRGDMEDKERMEMYRKLLLGSEDEKDDIDMEVTWEPDLIPTVKQDLLKEKQKKEKPISIDNGEETSKAELEMIMLGDEETNPEFEIDVNDERFSAVYQKSNFAIDRSSSMYRKTDAMEKLIQERQSRVESSSNTDCVKAPDRVESNDVDALLNSVKSKSALFGKKIKNSNKS